MLRCAQHDSDGGKLSKRECHSQLGHNEKQPQMLRSTQHDSASGVENVRTARGLPASLDEGVDGEAAVRVTGRADSNARGNLILSLDHLPLRSRGIR